MISGLQVGGLEGLCWVGNLARGRSWGGGGASAEGDRQAGTGEAAGRRCKGRSEGEGRAAGEASLWAGRGWGSEVEGGREEAEGGNRRTTDLDFLLLSLSSSMTVLQRRVRWRLGWIIAWWGYRGRRD